MLILRSLHVANNALYSIASIFHRERCVRRIVNLMHAARHSSWSLCCFNIFMWWGVPFNRPHKIRVVAVDGVSVKASINYSKKNMNHIRGIHACAIATVSEYVAGLCLLQSFHPKKYRIIMSSLEATYHYQAKRKLNAVAQLSPKAVDDVKMQLKAEASVKHVMVSEVLDVDNNHVATVKTTWQVKPWSKVKLKL